MLSGSRELEENNLKESLKVLGQEEEEGVRKCFPHFCGLIRVIIRTKFRRPPVAPRQRTEVFLWTERGPLLMSWLCSCSHSPFSCSHILSITAVIHWLHLGETLQHPCPRSASVCHYRLSLCSFCSLSLTCETGSNVFL